MKYFIFSLNISHSIGCILSLQCIFEVNKKNCHAVWKKKAYLWEISKFGLNLEASNCFYSLVHFYSAKAAMRQHTTRWNEWGSWFQAWIKYMYLCIYLFSRREGAITRAMCARDLRGVSAPVTSSSLLSHSHSSGVTRWWFSILQIKKKPSLLCWAVNLCW